MANNNRIEWKMKKQKIQAILDFYILTTKLKETIRTGWKLWEISAPRLESVAEHVYGTQVLALAIISEDSLSKAWINSEIDQGIYADGFLEFAEFIRDNEMRWQNE